MSCEDFLEFQDYLKKSRDIDDKLIYTLNASLPTQSFKTDLSKKCHELQDTLEANYRTRESSILRCINLATENVKQLKTKQSNNSDDFKLAKTLKKEQNKVRLLQTELGVEEIVKNRSSKLLYERCRSYLKPEAR
ncbi:protein MIX23 [Planococcus citri]|uniref:protein MIX23 n=1 Tax=Planococcus citri TaxID=170843 RepID=UPI0031F86F9D